MYQAPSFTLLYFSSFPREREGKKGREYERKRRQRQRDTERKEQKVKPSRCEFCHLLKKKKKIISLLCLEG